MNVISLPRGVVHTARAEDVYPTLEPGSVSMVWSDGPYAVGKDTWDRMKPADLPAWYEPHIEAWGRICAPSASVYHWGTADGWARVHSVYLAAGWTFRGLITWDKGIATLAGRLDTESMRTWPDVTEVCGFYQREPSLASMLNYERTRLGLSTGAAAKLIVGSESGAWRNWEYYGQGMDADNWVRIHKVFNDIGPDEVLPGCYRWRLQIGQSIRRYDETETRSEYDALRAPFTLPTGVTNVWRDPVPQGGVRLDHPCQKPLSAVRRAILASTRPGDLILDPFAGTCRVALVCEQLHADQARRHVSVEMDPAHVKAALRDIDQRTRQGVLF